MIKTIVPSEHLSLQGKTSGVTMYFPTHRKKLSPLHSPLSKKLLEIRSSASFIHTKYFRHI